MGILSNEYGSFDNYDESFLDDPRRRDEPRAKFYKNRKIRSISFDKPYTINMKSGLFKAEKIIFYEEGGIKKIFPLDGKLSGFWTEEDEYKLASEYKIKANDQIFMTKPIAIGFYKNGNIKNITLWPKEIIHIKLGYLDIVTRIGASFYENGKIKSCEPAKAINIDTPIGKILAYDTNAIGITGDTNSLNFYEDGKLKSIVTSENIIEIIDKNNNKVVYSPKFVNKYALDILIKETVKLDFKENKIIINDIDEYEINNYTFSIKRYVGDILNTIYGIDKGV